MGHRLSPGAPDEGDNSQGRSRGRGHRMSEYGRLDDICETRRLRLPESVLVKCMERHGLCTRPEDLLAASETALSSALAVPFHGSHDGRLRYRWHAQKLADYLADAEDDPGLQR